MPRSSYSLPESMIRRQCGVNMGEYLDSKYPKRHFLGFALDIDLKHFAYHSHHYRQLGVETSESLDRLYPLRRHHLRRPTHPNLSGLAPRQEPLRLAGCSQLLTPHVPGVMAPMLVGEYPNYEGMFWTSPSSKVDRSQFLLRIFITWHLRIAMYQSPVLCSMDLCLCCKCTPVSAHQPTHRALVLCLRHKRWRGYEAPRSLVDAA